MDDSYPLKSRRLLRLYELLIQHPEGLSAHRLLEITGVERRTLYRDLDALETHYDCKVENASRLWKLKSYDHLPPVSFNTMEAATIFIASRLLLSYSNSYNPNIISTFQHLSMVTPPALREQITRTMDWMSQQKQDKQFLANFHSLISAWMKGHPVKIGYRTPGKAESLDRIIEPYFIQPAALERANYVIGKCRLVQEVRTFKIERIRNITVLNQEKYQVPADFDANKYLGKAWSISVYDNKPAETIKICFRPPIDHIARETRWHPSQVTEPQPDGSVLISFNLSVTEEVESFILGWGTNVEVLEPKSLRIKIAAIAADTARLYADK